MSKPAKKMYYFILSKDYSYCVPSRDLKCVDPTSVQVDDEVHFSYNRHTKSGRVKYFSASESEVLKEIDKERKTRVSKEDSFHADRPRKSALKQREMMMELNKKPSGSQADNSEEVAAKTSKKKAKKLREENKEKAALSTEVSMILPDKVDVSADQQAGNGLNHDKHGLNSSGSSDTQSSSSSVDPKPKINQSDQLKDMNAIKMMENEGSSEPNSSQSPKPNEYADDNKPEESDQKGTPTHESPISDQDDEDNSNGKDTKVPDKTEQQRPSSRSSSASGTSSSRSSSSTSSGSSSSTSSSTSSSSTSSSSSDEKSRKRRHKKSRKHKKGKKSKKAKKHRKRAASESEDNKDQDGSPSDSEHASHSKSKKAKKHKKSRASSEAEDEKKDRDGSPSDSQRATHRKSKKAKKHRKRSRANSKSEDEKDRDGSPSDSHRSSHKKRKRSHSRRHEQVKRNLTIYPGKMYNYSESSDDVVRVHKDHEVYISNQELERITRESTSVPKLIKALTRAVFTMEALRNSTAQGYPNRIVGRKRLRQHHVRPRLDPEGREAILKLSREIQETKKSWRPRTELKTMSQNFTQAVKK